MVCYVPRQVVGCDKAGEVLGCLLNNERRVDCGHLDPFSEQKSTAFDPKDDEYQCVGSGDCYLYLSQTVLLGPP